MSGSLMNSPAVTFLLVVPSTVIWSYFSFGVVLAIGLARIFLHGDWQKSRGFDRLILFGPLFYAAPLAAFGTEHFTLAKAIASIVPAWMPWHLFWAYFVGVAFIAAALAIVARKMARTASILLGTMFFIWVIILHLPRVAANPRNGDEVTSLLVALAMSGVSFILAESFASDLSA